MRYRFAIPGGLLLILVPVLCMAASSGPQVFVKGTNAKGGSTAADTTGHLVKVCPKVIVTLDADKADYIVVRDESSGLKSQKTAVFNRAHILIYSGSTYSVKGAAKDTCKAIMNDWKAKR